VFDGQVLDHRHEREDELLAQHPALPIFGGQ